MRIILVILLALSTATQAQNILPTPQTFKSQKGTFNFSKRVAVSVPNSKSYAVDYLRRMLLGRGISVNTSSSKAAITLTIDKTVPAEGYILNIQPKQIKISAAGDAGFFYALQSLSQLFPSATSTAIPCAFVEDAPKYSYRSFMLDSGRQYQKISTIKKYLDAMAMMKMNTFHWHLTEGLGWRLEIKKYPNLTRTGAFVSQGKEQQGFYTQDDVREIIRYAANRNIMVVPEIDMPGHAEAAIIAYPELGCFGDTTHIKGDSGFTQNIFCAGKPHTIKFLKDVLDEVSALFPSQYVHVGGDEAPKGNWDKCPDCQGLIKQKSLKNSGELQLYFSAQIADYLKSKGKKAIFWEDVLYSEGYKLPDNVVIHWWNWRAHKNTGLDQSIARGHQVICGTNYYSYLNFPVTPWKGYKESRTFDIADTYDKNPSNLKDSSPLVLGMSAALWCDYNVTESTIDQRVFPRIFALSEQMWHKGDQLPFGAFYKIVQSKKAGFEKLGYEFGPGLRSEVPEGYNWD